MSQSSDTLDRNELQQLLTAAEPGPCASLYMPTVMAGPETQQNPIRYKNLLRELERELQQAEPTPDDLDALLALPRQLLDDTPFWQRSRQGLALFAAPGFYRCYRLPISVDEFVAAGSRFYLRPLLRLLSQDRRFYLLAISQHSARLFSADPHTVEAIELGDDVPTSLTEALGRELSEQQLQFHSGGPDGPIYHAQGAGDDDVKPELAQYLRRLDDGVIGLIGDGGGGGVQPPLIIAGVERLQAMYRELSRYKTLLDDGVDGNPEALAPDALADQARPLAQTHYDRQLDEQLDRYHALAADQRASDKLDDIVPAALDGRVDTLFIARSERCWGSYDPKQRRLERHSQRQPESDELLDLAAIHTFTQSGQVVICEPPQVPGQAPAAAIYRY